MTRIILCFVLTILLVSAPQGESTPHADHHQHLFSPAIAELISAKPIAADDLIALLDAAGIRRAAVLSVAYMFGSPSRTVENEYEKVKAENDWTGREVARFPDRLIGFCGFNPLEDYALDELARCAKIPAASPRHQAALRQLGRRLPQPRSH